MFKYMIGIDGGATKTLGAIFDSSGNILKQTISGFCNFGVDEEVSKANIKQVIDSLLEYAKDQIQIDYILIGSAGYSKLKNREEYVLDLQKRYGIKTNLVTDAEIALASIRKDSQVPTILILGGTGSIVLATKDNKIIRVGGSGHLLGDEGSAYHLAIKALKWVLSEYESGNELSAFSKTVLSNIQIETHEDLIHYVYSKNKKEIAELSKKISVLAESKNEIAVSLLQSEGEDLATQAIKAYHQQNSNEQVIIGLQGGFLLNAPYVKETLLNRLSESKIDFKICEEHPEPVIGSYYLGLTFHQRGELW